MSKIVSRLRETLIEVDRQLLDALSPSTVRTAEELDRIVKLEHARSATQRLLIAAEADELKDRR
jgi:hypothetical protein